MRKKKEMYTSIYWYEDDRNMHLKILHTFELYHISMFATR